MKLHDQEKYWIKGTTKMINYVSIEGTDVFDYYFPDFVGDPGYIFRYKKKENDYYLFSIPSFYLEEIYFEFFQLVIEQSMMLNAYLYDELDTVTENWWLITDKDRLIENLEIISQNTEVKNKLTGVIIDKNNTKMYEVLVNFICYIKQSSDYPLELIYW